MVAPSTAPPFASTPFTVLNVRAVSNLNSNSPVLASSTRKNPSTLPCATAPSMTVDFTVAGTATDGTDYTLSSPNSLVDQGSYYTLTFAAGQSTTTLNVAATDDEVFEFLEILKVEISPNSNYVVGTPSQDHIGIWDSWLTMLVAGGICPDAIRRRHYYR